MTLRSTGDAVLDGLVGGGLPAGRVLGVGGGPGTFDGRRGLAEGFLRAGLAAAETGLLVAPGTPSALATRTGLPVDADGLTAVAVGADGGEPTCAVLGGASPTVDSVVDLDCTADRVVVADVPALAGSGVDVAAFLDRCRAGGAAVVATGRDDLDGGTGAVPAVGRLADGVVTLDRRTVGASAHTGLRVEHLTWGAPDNRSHRLVRTAEGIRVVARTRTPPNVEFLSTDIDGFDELTGGGVVRGQWTLLEHDGFASHWPFTASLCASVVERGAAVILYSSPEAVLGRLDDLLADRVGGVCDLMERDQLYVIDLTSTTSEPLLTDLAHLPEENVIVQSSVGSIQGATREAVERASGRPVLNVVEGAPIRHLVDDDQARQLFYWAAGNVLLMEGTSLLFTANRRIIGDELMAFYTGLSKQVLKTWQDDDGLQYVCVEKSPEGGAGETRVVEPLDEVPYVRLV